jgi:hypothetical protein
MAKEIKSSKKGNEGSVVRQCTCEHESQDNLHGKKMRVHNGNKDGWKCTVCGNIIKF